MTMCDEVLADLQKPNKRLAGFVPKQFERLANGRSISYDGFDAARRCYKEIRQASRYIVSNELLDYLVPIVMDTSPAILTERIIEARLPHENVWIEWDEIHRQTRMRQWVAENNIKTLLTDIEDILPNAGYLCMQTEQVADYADTCWLGMPFVNGKNTGELAKEFNGITVSSPYGITVYPELNSPLVGAVLKWPDVNSNKTPSNFMAIDSEARDLLKMVSAALGKGFIGKRLPLTGDEDDLKNLYSGFSSHQTFASEWMDQRKQHRWINYSCDMMEGDARFLVTLLSVLNYDWIIKDEVSATAAPRRIRHGKILPRNSHTTLNIDLPKAKGVTMLPAPYIEGASRRQHEVRGHWRLYRTTGKRVWVRAHKRGDAKLGVISKDYSLQARRRR